MAVYKKKYDDDKIVDLYSAYPALPGGSHHGRL
jgi:hypothetical protein